MLSRDFLESLKDLHLAYEYALPLDFTVNDILPRIVIDMRSPPSNSSASETVPRDRCSPVEPHYDLTVQDLALDRNRFAGHSRTMTSNPVKAVFGGTPIGPGLSLAFVDEDSIEKAYKLLEEGGCDTVDTARLYGSSEEWIGKTGGGKRFTIDSKTPGGFAPGTSTSETIPQLAKETVERLGVKSVDVYYIHAPDPSVGPEDHQRRVADVKQVYDICADKGYPLPTVYQGNYSAVTRRMETELVPTLHKLGIASYVYSPFAGGLLTKTVERLREGTEDACGMRRNTLWVQAQDS
ncbi:NADP-dependent oxidoreductase domain-containing protein [Mycena olivaceomarginata]|nr:NADP-dependent oxidoreductase domain-containing protein [Mycena olivaceomarginata]